MNKILIIAGLVSGIMLIGDVALATTYYTEQFDSGDNRGYTADGDWAVGSYKAQCNYDDPMSGISATAIGIRPDLRGHSAICSAGAYIVGSGSTGTYGTETVHSLSGADDRGDTGTGDWDVGYTKAECAQSEAVSGVAQSGDSSLNMTTILCTWIESEIASNDSSCTTLVFSSYSDNRLNTASGDWAVGYSKNECGSNQILKGVSSNPNTGEIHAILCCDAEPFPH
jgi:hypothetical protein